MIDYYLLPKAAYHYARKFYSPILLSIDHEPGEALNVWVVNDSLESYQDEIELAVYDFYGRQVFSKEWSVVIEANASSQIGFVLEEEALSGLEPEEAVMVLRSKTFENIYYFRDQKDLRLEKAELKVDVRENEITILTKSLARMVTIEIDMEQLIFEDNFFDLLANETKVIKVEQAQGKEIPWETLRIKAINSEGMI